MGRATRVAIVVFAALLVAAPTSGAARKGVKAKLVTRSVKAKSRATLKCPKGYSALNGDVVSLPDGVLATRSRPGPGRRKWTFGFAGGGKSKARAQVSCARLTGRRARVRTAVRGNIRVNDFATKSVPVSCTRREVPTGWGVKQSTGSSAARMSQLLVPPEVDLFSVKLSGRRVSFGLRNDSTNQGQIDLYVRCLRRSRKVRILRRTFHDTIATGERSKRHRCPPRRIALAAGFDFDPASAASIVSARPDGGRAAQWLFQSALLDQVDVDNSLVCLRLRTKSRRRRR